MKTAIFAAATVIEVIAWAAIAGSLLLLFDGWAAWLAVSAVFAGFVFLWASAVLPRARWPLPAAWRLTCKVLTSLFAAEVLWVVAEWAGVTFAVAAVSVEVLQYRLDRDQAGEGVAALSRAADRDA